MTNRAILGMAVFFGIALQPFSSVVAEEEPLILTNNYWPPYKGETLPKGGIITDITMQALARAGYEVAVAIVPWNRAYAGTVSGRYHVITAIWSTPEREKEIEYSNPIVSSRIVLIHRSDYEFTFNSLEDLRGETVGVTAGYGYPEDFQNADFFVREESETLSLSLRKLIFGRTNVIVAEEIAARYAVATEYPDAVVSLKYSEIALQENPMHVAFSRARPDHVEIRDRFNEALDEMRKNGTLKDILEFHGVSRLMQ
ncbi:amino acid ABC transporter substrate-binding protein [Parasedimentitalea maritima]|uniref:Amino acid ABC transporter substrate-binding protein n=1 Tax=Parasedimentitalea maritima TaxID=2578117 RepID=A0ABY2UP09_9RHOB|nr:transporter substrate-binding domain-containing protein [Zongyanglinia marina]TLP56008.1 amino acid ABC transporter substrate-binding protein [Zongyanglinia marina]